MSWYVDALGQLDTMKLTANINVDIRQLLSDLADQTAFKAYNELRSLLDTLGTSIIFYQD